MKNFYPALTVNDRNTGTVVYGRHPHTGEKYPGEKYTITGYFSSTVDGETIVLVDDAGVRSESSSQFLCR